MRIAFLGTRGIPANYGGFETFVEQLSTRLADRGHDVTVYARSGNYDRRIAEYRGVKIVMLPSVRKKSLDTLTHAAISSVHAWSRSYDIAYYCNVATSWFSWLPRVRGAKVLLNTDGLEWERAKWNWLGKTFYKVSEHAAVRFPNLLVSDSRVIQDYYKKKFNRDSSFVAYGADIVERHAGQKHLAPLGVEPDRYFLFVSRLEPENNAHLLVKAFEQVETDMKLLIVGDAPFAHEYIRGLKATKDPRIIFPGALYGEVYNALRANAYVYINAMEVGGTHPAILEAMGAGNCVLVSDISYNEEAVADAGLTFRNKDAGDMRDKMRWLVEHPDEVRRFGQAAVERVRTVYNWEKVTDEYEGLFAALLKG